MMTKGYILILNKQVLMSSKGQICVFEEEPKLFIHIAEMRGDTVECVEYSEWLERAEIFRGTIQ